MGESPSVGISIKQVRDSTMELLRVEMSAGNLTSRGLGFYKSVRLNFCETCGANPTHSTGNHWVSFWSLGSDMSNDE